MIVSKFGGSSVADATQIEKVRQIIESDSERKIVVVSAPGKSAANQDKYKVTDSLFNIAKNGNHFPNNTVSAQASYDFILSKFSNIITNLNLNPSMLDKIAEDLNSNKGEDFLASRGEHYSARLIAEHFQNKGIETHLALPEEKGIIVTDQSKDARYALDAHHAFRSLPKTGVVIIPGYYGVTKSGDVRVLSRGGSDLTGGEVAASLKADLYENWTDTNGVCQVDPRVIKDANVIPELTYREIRVLASRGFDVFHYAAMLGCKKYGVPIVIKNTNNPSAPGTRVVTERVPTEIVVGIGRVDNLAYVSLAKDMMDDEIGFTESALKIFKDKKISTHHYPTDVDELTIIVGQNDLKGKVDVIQNDLMSKLHLSHDQISISYGYSLLVPTGIGMKNKPGVLASAVSALAQENINVEFITQTPSQLSILIGVKSVDAERGLRALYSSLLNRLDK